MKEEMPGMTGPLTVCSAWTRRRNYFSFIEHLLAHDIYAHTLAFAYLSHLSRAPLSDARSNLHLQRHACYIYEKNARAERALSLFLHIV